MYGWGDNDHGQQGNGTTTMNKRPGLVQGIMGRVNRVACGSSHSVAWLAPDPAPPTSHKPVLFTQSKDPLGISILGKYKSFLNRLYSYRRIKQKAEDDLYVLITF